MLAHEVVRVGWAFFKYFILRYNVYILSSWTWT